MTFFRACHGDNLDSVCSSEMATGLTQGSSVDFTGPDQVPVERYGTIEDMGGLVMFLASRAGAYISGAVHLTDGGRTMLFASSY